MDSITTNPEYEALLPKLPKKEYDALKESIQKEGQHYPIVVNKEKFILDGHNRFEICKELNIEPKVETKIFPSKLFEEKFVIESNLRRRHLTPFQKAELAAPLMPIERELAKQRMSKAGKIGVKIREGRVGSNEHTHNFDGKARDIVAREVGLSPITFQRCLTIMEKGSEELKKKVRRGKTSITYAYGKVRRAEKHTNPPPLPKEQFDVILADPPWEYDLPLRGDPEFHYQSMALKEICSLKIPASQNAILFLWATNPKLKHALAVLKAWGFEYKTNMVWVKDKIGTGYYLRGKHELLLIGKRGNIPVPKEESRPPSVLFALTKEHSTKPDAIYEIIERMYPNRKYLELFARKKRNGWFSWGNESKN